MSKNLCGKTRKVEEAMTTKKKKKKNSVKVVCGYIQKFKFEPKLKYTMNFTPPKEEL